MLNNKDSLLYKRSLVKQVANNSYLRILSKMTSKKKSSEKKLEPMELCLEDKMFEESLAVAKSSKSDRKFDVTIGHIEDIIMDDEFQQLQKEFLEKYYDLFEDVEENKLIYTDIHKEYTQLIEKFLETELYRRMPGFNMADFQKQLASRRKELDGEVFEILLTFTDFVSFKEMVLDYKANKEGRTMNLGDGFQVLRLQELPSTTMDTQTTFSSVLQPNLTKNNGEPVAEIPSDATLHEMMSQSEHEDSPDVCPSIQSLSLQGDGDFGLCLIGSGIKPLTNNK